MNLHIDSGHARKREATGVATEGERCAARQDSLARAQEDDGAGDTLLAGYQVFVTPKVKKPGPC
jgi:hypothetical protein